jgi:hypothetical protein
VIIELLRVESYISSCNDAVGIKLRCDQSNYPILMPATCGDNCMVKFFNYSNCQHSFSEKHNINVTNGNLIIEFCNGAN